MADFVQKLVDIQHPEWSQTWSWFLFNVPAVRQLGNPPEAGAILVAGDQWIGEGWTTGKASKVLYDVTGVPLVRGNFGDSKGAFLYALCLRWGLDVGTFNLPERSAEAAFILAAAFNADEMEEVEAADQDTSEEEKDGKDQVFAWEEYLEELPADLTVLWRRYGEPGTSRFDTRSMLENTGRYSGLPSKAPDNNCLSRFEANGAAGRLDKALKVQQQVQLNSLRVLVEL